MVLVVVLAEAMVGGLVVATLVEALAEATLAALAEAVDSTAEVTDSMVEAADSMAAGAGSTVEAMGPMAAGMGTGAMATTGTMGTGTMVTTGIMAIVGVTGTTGTTMDIGAGAAGRILGTTAGVGIIRGTTRTMVIRMAITTAAITAAETTEMAMQAVQELPNCSADFHGPDITMVKSMESWALRRGEQFVRTSATMGLEVPRSSALIGLTSSTDSVTLRSD